ncbi:TFPI2 variant, putative, partial [Ixodes scapularis]
IFLVATVLRAATAPRNRTDCPSDFCKQDPDIGSGEANLFRWFYNHKTQSCKVFLHYGGRGTCNVFNTMQKCQDVCGRWRSPKHSLKYTSEQTLPKRARRTDIREEVGRLRNRKERVDHKIKLAMRHT